VAIRLGHNELLLPMLKAGADPADAALLKVCAEAGNREALAILKAFLGEAAAGAGSAVRTETKAAGPSGMEGKREVKPMEPDPMSRRPDPSRTGPTESKRKP